MPFVGLMVITEKNKEYSRKLKNILEISSEPVADLGLLSACKNNNPELVILCRGNKKYNLFEWLGNDWSIIKNGARNQY